MAMKEIQLQPNDHRTIRSVAEELKILEGINHRHLVKYFGVEIHRVCVRLRLRPPPSPRRPLHWPVEH